MYIFTEAQIFYLHPNVLFCSSLGCIDPTLETTEHRDKTFRNTTLFIPDWRYPTQIKN